MNYILSYVNVEEPEQVTMTCKGPPSLHSLQAPNLKSMAEQVFR